VFSIYIYSCSPSFRCKSVSVKRLPTPIIRPVIIASLLSAIDPNIPIISPIIVKQRSQSCTVIAFSTVISCFQTGICFVLHFNREYPKAKRVFKKYLLEFSNNLFHILFHSNRRFCGKSHTRYQHFCVGWVWGLKFNPPQQNDEVLLLVKFLRADGCCFACYIGTQETEDFSFFNFEGEVVNCDKGLIIFG
jgi:hypothetical protein